MSEASGEKVLDAIVEIVELGVDIHGDLALGSAIGEEEIVLIGGSDGVGVVVGGVGRWREIAEGEEGDDVVGIEDAQIRVLLELEEDLDEGFFGEEEEAEAGGIGGGEGGGDGDAGDSDGGVTGVSESELLQEDHEPGVGGDF